MKRSRDNEPTVASASEQEFYFKAPTARFPGGLRVRSTRSLAHVSPLQHPDRPLRGNLGCPGVLEPQRRPCAPCRCPWPVGCALRPSRLPRPAAGNATWFTEDVFTNAARPCPYPASECSDPGQLAPGRATVQAGLGRGPGLSRRTLPAGTFMRHGRPPWTAWISLSDPDGGGIDDWRQLPGGCGRISGTLPNRRHGTFPARNGAVG